MKTVLTFICVFTVNVIIICALYAVFKFGFTVFQSPPSYGDLEAVYLPLTAFGYTAQILSLLSLIGVTSLHITHIFTVPNLLKSPRLLRMLIKNEVFLHAYCLMFVCSMVVLNKSVWNYRLIWDADRYGYHTTKPAAAAVICAAFTMGLVYTNLKRGRSKDYALPATLSASFLVLFFASWAALHVAISISQVPI